MFNKCFFSPIYFQPYSGIYVISGAKVLVSQRWNAVDGKFQEIQVFDVTKFNPSNLLNIGTKEIFFKFNNKYYKQVDGGAMESLLGPA